MRQQLLGREVDVTNWPTSWKPVSTAEEIEICLRNAEEAARLEAEYRTIYESPQTELGSPTLFEAHRMMVRYKCEQAHWRKYVAALRVKLAEEEKQAKAAAARLAERAHQTVLTAQFLPAREAGADDGDDEEEQRLSPWEDIGAGQGGR